MSTVDTEVRTFSTAQVCSMTNTTYRQVNYWASQGLIYGQPHAPGSGLHRRWTTEQVNVVRSIAASRNWREVKQLRDALDLVRIERDALRAKLAEL